MIKFGKLRNPMRDYVNSEDIYDGSFFIIFVRFSAIVRYYPNRYR